MRPVRPVIAVNDYDQYDDPHCNCETCLTPWGAEALPLTNPAAGAASRHPYDAMPLTTPAIRQPPIQSRQGA
jgi:hypothetical protein